MGGIAYDFIKSANVNIQKLQDFLISERVNLFCFSSGANEKEFICVPCRRDSPIFKNPRMTAFILVYDQINSCAKNNISK